MVKPGDLHLVEGDGDPIRRQAAAWFARLRADDVSEREQRDWQDWLARDSRHREAYTRLEQLWSGLGAYAPHPEIAQRLHDGEATARPAAAAPRRGRMPWHIAVAASVCLAVVAGWLLWPAAAPEMQYATAIGEHRSLTLEDGSRVTLDTDTRMRVRFTRNERRITLDQGRAYFQVAKAPQPLSVRTENGDVQAVGTAFEVYRRSQETEVTLIEGRVLLLPDPTSKAQAPIPMEAGHRARMGRQFASPAVEAVATIAAPNWLSGRLVFNEEQLPSVLNEFNRYSQRPIVLGDATLAEIRISGVFRSDDPQAFLGALRDAYALSADASPSGALVLNRAGR